jgi:hypothetical protein
MFEEHIAHGNDMIRRLELEVGLSPSEVEMLPAHQRVPIAEAVAWQKAIEEKLRTNFGPEVFARYNIAWEIFRDEVKRREGTPTSQALNAWRRIVAYLGELQERANARSAAAERSVSSTPMRDAPAILDHKVKVRNYDLFISHASEDKDAIARPLYSALIQKGVSVWFDEATLELGDSLRRKIDEGLSRCRYGVVILSPRFLEKQWPQRELDGLVARETASGEKAILPVWHGLDSSILVAYSPPLADRLAARSEEGVEAIADKVLRVLRR